MDLPRRVEAALRAVLPRAAQLDVAAAGPELRVRVAGTRLTAAWLERGTPAAVHQAHAASGKVGLVIAPQFTEAARLAARLLGLGWVDEQGGAELVAGSIVVVRESLPTPKRQPSGWTPATLGVVEALLLGCKATVSALRAETHASPSTVALALELLTDTGLLETKAARGRHSGRRLTQPRALLDSYATAARDLRVRRSLKVGVVWRDPVADLRRFGAQLDANRVQWAATGALAAAVQAPFQTQVAPWIVYVPATSVSDLLVAAGAAGLTPLDGGRLELRAFPSPITRRLLARTDDVTIVPWPRSYADLRWTGVRGEGAADHLAEVMLQQTPPGRLDA